MIKKEEEFCIKYKEMEESLKALYHKYKKSIENEKLNDNGYSIYLKGFCHALERVFETYGDKSIEEIEKIKMPIIGKISMQISNSIDLDEPTYKRKGINISTPKDK